mmetsp:Transcript_790/g.2941  ORF Transcript_790/g.2941 Transcript_790/m.2941 type:complete len:603 (+) Transcript_790:90-1898(+)
MADLPAAARDDEDDALFDALYAGRETAERKSEDAEGQQTLRGRRLFAKGLAFNLQRPQIRSLFEAHGALERLELCKTRPGTATVDFCEPRGASAALLALDGVQGPRTRLSVQFEVVFFDGGDDAGGDSSGDEEAFCPVSFSGRGSRAARDREKVVERKWKTKRLWCGLCGACDHFAQGCALNDRTYHQRLVAGSIEPIGEPVAPPPPPPPPTAPASGFGVSTGFGVSGGAPAAVAPLGRGRGASTPSWMKDPTLLAKKQENEAAAVQVAVQEASRAAANEARHKADEEERRGRRRNDDSRRRRSSSRDRHRKRSRSRSPRQRADSRDGAANGFSRDGAANGFSEDLRRDSKANGFSEDPRRFDDAPAAAPSSAPRDDGPGPRKWVRRRDQGLIDEETARDQWREIVATADAAHAASAVAAWPMEDGLYASYTPAAGDAPNALEYCRVLVSGATLRIDATPRFKNGRVKDVRSIMDQLRPETCADASAARMQVLFQMTNFTAGPEIVAKLERTPEIGNVGEARDLLLSFDALDAQLPAGWSVAWSQDHGAYYYHDANTGNMSWVSPLQVEEPAPEPVVDTWRPRSAADQLEWKGKKRDKDPRR